MQKIIEIKGTDFLKGKSAQPNLPIGGLFQQYQGIDPFEQSGVALPSLIGTSIVPGTSVKNMTSWNDGTTAYIYAQSDTKLYRILRDSPYTITDQTAQIAATTTVFGAIIWNGKYIYASNFDLRANSLPVLLANDVQILAGFNSNQESRPMAIGADGNLYVGDNSRIHSITSATGTAGNSFQPDIDPDFTIRDVINDGRYIVILADNNAILNSQRKVGNYRCRIYFWDMVKTASGGAKILPDVAYDLVGDSYLLGGKYLENGIYFFSNNGLYVCNSVTSPRMIRPFVGTNAMTRGLPANSYQIAVSKGSIYWIHGGIQANLSAVIYAYGNPITGQPKIFYEPYLNTGAGAGVNNALSVIGDQFWVSNQDPKIYVQNILTTRGQGNITTVVKTMDKAYRYDYTKIALASPLTSGQSILVEATNGQGLPISSETASYSAANPKQTLMFRRLPSTVNLPSEFEEIKIRVSASGGAAVQRIATYATPINDGGQDL